MSTSPLSVPTHALAAANVTLRTMDAIANSDTTQIFVMENTPVVKKRITCSPLKVALANGRNVFSTHECNVHIVGLPTVLTGHIIPDLSIMSLFRIQVLTEVGCEVHLNKHKCTVRYDNKIILEGGKDSTTDLWTFPIGSPHPSPSSTPTPDTSSDIAHAHCDTTQITFFTHTV
jgi:hypothetical protein